MTPPPSPGASPSHATSPTASDEAVLVGAGDVASCSTTGGTATARLIETIPGTVFLAGDGAYESGSASEFQDCYAPTWGAFLDRTRPAPGNHDYGSAGASGYFEYFGARAGEAGRGYYSYDLGAWHVVVLNSNCGYVSCAKGSAQEAWLRRDLATHPARCTLAYWHHPRFSSGLHGSDEDVAPLFAALYEAGAEVVINGHDHDYERFAPQDQSGTPDGARGIREFVAGTGGRSLYPFRSPIANSEVRASSTFGVLKLTLRPDSYTWQFIPVEGGGFVDSGSQACH